jgi:hypothetical protein
MTFRPLHERVLARRIEAAAKTAGRIVIPDTAQEKPQEGVVVSEGSGTRTEELRAAGTPRRSPASSSPRRPPSPSCRRKNRTPPPCPVGVMGGIGFRGNLQ